MLTDTQKLEWIAEHLTSFNIDICPSAKLTYIDDRGFHNTVSVTDDVGESTPLELLNLAIEKATNTQS